MADLSTLRRIIAARLPDDVRFGRHHVDQAAIAATIERVLDGDELLVDVAQARKLDSVGVVAATDRRLLFIQRKRGRLDVTSYPYAGMTTVASAHGGENAGLRFVSGTHTITLTSLVPVDAGAHIGDVVARQGAT